MVVGWLETGVEQEVGRDEKLMVGRLGFEQRRLLLKSGPGGVEIPRAERRELGKGMKAMSEVGKGKGKRKKK